jgi:hypothetical protein
MVSTNTTAVIAVVPRYFEVTASLRPRLDGQPGFLGEVDDPSSPIAGVSAFGLDSDTTRHRLLQAAWTALHDPDVRWMTGLDVGTLAGVRLHLTSHHEVAAAELVA